MEITYGAKLQYAFILFQLPFVDLGASKSNVVISAQAELNEIYSEL